MVTLHVHGDAPAAPFEETTKFIASAFVIPAFKMHKQQNVAYNSALRQSKALRSELTNLSPQPTAAEIGNVSASLAAFTKTLDEYSSLARQEIVPKKQAEAQERVRRFRDDLADMRTQVDGLRKAREDAQHQANRAELLGRRPYQATPENPYANAQATTTHSAFHPRHHGGSTAGGPPATMGSADEMREAHAFREQNFFAGTNQALDDYIARGQAVLGDLTQQREMLKGTQKRLYGIANTLGVSGDTIRMVERRAREDKWIFAAGVIVFFLFCWLNVLCGRDLDAPRLGQHVVARAQVAAHLGLPGGHVPLEAGGADDAGLLERDDADVLGEDVVAAGAGLLAHVDAVRARLEQEGQARAGQQVDAALGVARIRLEQIQVVQLAEALVDAAADAAEGDDVDARRVGVAHPADGLAEVGRLLVLVVDDLRGLGLGEVKIADRGREGVQITNDRL
ncbi:Protein transport protein BOS1 [Paramyrothecium foliicola]|nr:Protein transport protein BOS1 [Paramyrothecium foliicola]